MLSAKDVSETIKDLYLSATQEKERLEKLIQEYNEKVSDFTHELELAKLNVVQAYKVMKAMQDVLIERRRVKNEWVNLKKLIDNLGNDFSKRVDRADNAIDRSIAYQQDGLYKRKGVIESVLNGEGVVNIAQ